MKFRTVHKQRRTEKQRTCLYFGKKKERESQIHTSKVRQTHRDGESRSTDYMHRDVCTFFDQLLIALKRNNVLKKSYHLLEIQNIIIIGYIEMHMSRLEFLLKLASKRTFDYGTLI